MLKKIMTVLSICSCFILLANETSVGKEEQKVEQQKKYCGFYLGVDGGVASIVTDAVTTYIGVDNGYTEKFTTEEGSFNGVVSGFAGYGHQFSNNFYCALEGYVGGPSITLELKNQSYAVDIGSCYLYKIKRQWFCGGIVHIGYFINKDCLFYLSVGAEGDKWKGKDIRVNSSGTTTLSAISLIKTSFVPGVGLLTYFYGNCYIRLDYKIVLSPDINVGSYLITRGDDSYDRNFKLEKVYESRANLSLGYQF
jgi:hypothetical protein